MKKTHQSIPEYSLFSYKWLKTECKIMQSYCTSEVLCVLFLNMWVTTGHWLSCSNIHDYLNMELIDNYQGNHTCLCLRIILFLHCWDAYSLSHLFSTDLHYGISSIAVQKENLQWKFQVHRIWCRTAIWRFESLKTLHFHYFSNSTNQQATVLLTENLHVYKPIRIWLSR